MESSAEISKLNPAGENIEIRDLEAILRESQNDKKLKVIDYTTSNLVATGDNYSSIMVWIEAKIRHGSSKEEEVLHLVAKTVKHLKTPFINWSVVLKKEIFAYSELMPMYRDLERDAGVAENDLIDCMPKYMGHRYTLKEESNEVDDYSLLLMEDMKAQGYYMADRKKGMDLQHAKIALSNLARYHALGVALRQKRPSDFAKAKLEAENLGLIVDIMRLVLDSVLETIRADPQFAKHLSKIEAWFAYQKTRDTLPEVAEPWVTIIHGDFWTNNFLFHKDEHREVDSVKFVDFQLYLYTSPCKDLSFFLCCSVDQDISDRLHELIELYYEKFIDTLRCMGCDTVLFTRELFDEELKKQLAYGFPTFALCLKYFSYEVSEEEVKNNDIGKSIMDSSSEKYKQKLVKLVKIYEENGWFEQ